MSLDELVSGYLVELTTRRSSEETLRDLEELWAETSGDSGGRTWTREEVHERGGLR